MMHTDHIYRTLAATLATDPSARVTREPGGLVRILSAILGEYRDFCPVTYVAATETRRFYSTIAAHTAAKEMAYPQFEASRTIAVADGVGSHTYGADYRRERRLLLKTVAPYVRGD